MAIADRTESLDTAVADSQASIDTMETEAAEFFAARAAAEPLHAPLNPVVDALEKATPAKEPAKPAPAAPAKAPDATKPAGKVPGAPILKKAEPKPVADPASTKPDATADFSDVPKEYKPGEMRGKNWDRLHAKSDHFETLAQQREAEATALRAELEAAKSAKATGVLSEETKAMLESLQKERDQYKSQLQAFAGERIFDTESKPRREAAISKAKQAVAPSDIKNIEMLLQTPGSAWREEQLNQIISGLTPLRATQLANAVAEWDGLDLEREAARARGGEMLQKNILSHNEQQARENQERIQRATTTFEAELKEWEPVGLNAEEIASARSVYSGQGATLQDASRAALWAVAGPRVATQLQEAQSRVEELEGQLAKLRGAQPGVGASAAGALPSGADDEDDPSITTYADRIAKQAMRAGVRFGT